MALETNGEPHPLLALALLQLHNVDKKLEEIQESTEHARVFVFVTIAEDGFLKRRRKKKKSKMAELI